MAGSINVNQTTNNVTVQDQNGKIIITDNNSGIAVNVTQPVTNVITVATPGPQGPVGPIPSSGAFTGSFSGSFVGNLTGTASNAVSASYAVNSTNSTNAVSASYAENSTNATNATSASYATNATSASYALTASYLTGYVSPFPYSGSAVITGSLLVSGSSTLTNIGPAIFSGSLIVTQGITGSLSGSALTATSASFAATASFALNVNPAATASYAVNALSASFALTASYLSGYVSPFPYTGSAIISGSLEVTGSVSATAGFSGSFSGSFQGNGSGLTNIPASGITGLNLSQIATGSISASVSLGTGSFTVTSGSSTFIFVSSSGNVGIGTTTPINTLDINGSTRINNRFLYHQGASAIQYYMTSNAWSGTNSIFFGDDSSSTVGSITYNHQFDSLAFNVNSAERFRVASTGNILIGTTTDAGYRLDVNGTGNFEGNLRLGVAFQLLFNNNNVGIYRDSNTLRLGGFGGVEILSSNTNISAQTIRLKVFDTGNVTIGTTTDSGFRLDVNGTARFSGNVTGVSGTQTSVSFGVNGLGNGMYNPGGNSVGFSTNSAPRMYIDASNIILATPLCVSNSVTNSPNASAMLDVQSTSRGFLPPRMTLAQRVAISSPASGLIVYETGSATTEGLWLNETTGWQQLLTNSGSQSISGSLNVTSS